VFESRTYLEILSWKALEASIESIGRGDQLHLKSI
jgi:hypothetical protein